MSPPAAAPQLEWCQRALHNSRTPSLSSHPTPQDLARLSLSDPEYLAVHADAGAATPLRLQQAVAVVEAPRKLDALWSFLKAHLAAKTIVFLSTCKQVGRGLKRAACARPSRE